MRWRTQLANSVSECVFFPDRRWVLRDPALVEVSVESVSPSPGGKGVASVEGFTVGVREGCPSGMTSELEGVTDD